MTFPNISPNEDEMASGEENLQLIVAITAQKNEEYSNKTGFCLDCGGEIPEERLKIFPECNCCVGCQKERDQNARKSPFSPFVPPSRIFNSIGEIEEERERDCPFEERGINKVIEQIKIEG